MSSLGQLSFLLAPLILGGVSNMVLVKLPVLTSLKQPMDGGRVLRDGQRLFGDNKTWKGFLGMIVLTAGWFTLTWALVTALPALQPLALMPFEEYGPGVAVIFGAWWGLAYVLAELPNSWMKRRLHIAPGKQPPGARRALFAFVDQADSAVGCLVAMLVFFRPSAVDWLAALALAIAFHYGLNLLLFAVGLKRDAG
ncbi:MAG: CDP-archaeol synthase [Deltaproteobacteria bacterium]|nr:CDP-archaeol synthase [Deltaproteobacteria bacterium]